MLEYSLASKAEIIKPIIYKLRYQINHQLILKQNLMQE